MRTFTRGRTFTAVTLTLALGVPMGFARREEPAVTAADRYGWGRPVASDEFTGKGLDPDAWEIYDGPGHGGNGRRSPKAVSVRDGHLTITGTPDGTTGGLSWLPGAQKTGRWEARVRTSRASAAYHPVLLLWPVKGGGGTAPKGGGGEVDYLEVVDDGTRQSALFFLHFGPVRKNWQLDARVKIDLTGWHTFAVEWTKRAMTGFVDGRRWFHSDDPDTLPPGKMGQAIQLDWFPEDEGRTHRSVPRNKPAKLQLDWIRMYRV